MTNTDLTPRDWVIVGYGRVGQSLKLLADRLGATVAATWNRSRHAADDADVTSPNPCWGTLPSSLDGIWTEPRLVWLTVVDDAIESTFAAVADELVGGSLVVHTSGSLSSAILSDYTDLPVASLHPLQAISDPRTAAERFDESFWTIEGDDQAVDTVIELVAGAGISPARIEPDAKVLYHASAATAANLLVSLMDTAIEMATAAGLDGEQAHKILVNLADSSLDNLAEHPPARALTGPSARGDLDTIERHRRALHEMDDDSLQEIYDLLTRRALDGLSGPE